MSYQVFSPFLQLREFDDSGKLLANGFMYFYQAGTSTLGNVYSDSIGTAAPNPVQLNGAGTAVIFGDPVAYKVVIKDSTGVQIFAIDNVFPFGQGSGSSGLGTVAVVANYNALRTLSIDYDAVLICGYAIAGDGGGGLFFKSISSASDNNGTILVRASTRYVRSYSGLIDPRWFGVSYATATDQTTALDSATAVGPVQIAGLVYQAADHHYKGAYSFLPGGGIYSSGGTPAAYFDDGSKIIDGAAGMFASTIKVSFGKGVTTEIRTSWFSSLSQALCTTYSYPLLVDSDATTSVDFIAPYNYRVDFPNGSLISVTAAVKIDIENLAYTGSSQIIKFGSLAYISTVKVGQGSCLLEWFGAVPGAVIGADNSIPAKAAFAHGNINLIASYYRVGAVDSGWIFSHGLTLSGSNQIAYNTLDISQPLSFTDLSTSYVNIIGAATIASSGTAVIDHTTIPGADAQNSATIQDINAGVYLPANYFAAGNAGLLRNSTDLTTWTTHSAGSGAIRSIAKGPIWIAVSDSGSAYRSTDGGVTWSAITIGAQNWYKVKWIRGQFVVVGSSGGVYVSADGVTWNSRTVTTTATFRDFDYSTTNNLWIIVGASATVYTSADLVTFTLRALPSGTTGDLYAVVCYAGTSASTTLITGALSGSYLIASDSISYQSFILGTTETIYSATASPTTILLTGGNGNLYTSTSAGQQFTKRMSILGAAGLSSAYSNGQWVIGAASGYVWSTADLNTWASHYVGAASDVLAVYIGAPVYATVGNLNTVQTSATGSGKDWMTITVDGSSANWYNVRVWNGIAFLCGAGGRLFISSDFVTFSQILTGLTSDIYDIVYNSTTQKYAICGASGLVRWCTKSDILAPTPTWTAVSTGTANTLTRAAWTGALYVFTGTATVVTSTDLTGGGTGVVNNVINGMLATPISGGNLYIMYGNSGLILTSTDRINWTKQTSGTSSHLMCGIVQGGFACIAGASGTLIRADITNPATWSNISVGTSQNINALKYSSGRSEIGLCGNAGIAYKSADNGLTWASMVTGSGQDMYDIWGNGTNWECCGNLGAWYTSSNASTWTMRETSVRASQPYPIAIRCGVGNVAFGDDGWIGYFDSKPTVHQQQNRFGMRGINFTRYTNGTLLTSAGTSYGLTFRTDVDGTNCVSCIGGTNLSDSSVTNLCQDAANNALYAVGGSSIWYTNLASNYMYWTQKAQSFSGVRDMQLHAGYLNAVGDSGVVVQSNNGLVWNTNSIAGDTTMKYSVEYYLSQGLMGARLGITTYIAPSGGAVVLAGLGGLVWSGAASILPSLSIHTGTITYSTIQTPIISSIPATVRNSSIYSIDKAGDLTDSVVANSVGTFYGNILRSTLTLFAPAGIIGNILISESSITKNASYDLTNVLFNSITGSTLQIDASALEYTGTLAYSEDATLKIKLNECSNSGSFAAALSNGFAKVFLYNCNAVPNSTAYNIDGSSLDVNTVTLMASQTITAALTDWTGLPSGTTSDGTSLTLATQVVLGSIPTGPTTLRWHGTSNQLRVLQNLGGRIKAEITYPGGYTPDPTASIKVAMVKPSFVIAYHPSVEGETVIGAINDILIIGAQTPAPISKQSGKIVAYSNVWGGYGSVMTAKDGGVGYHTMDPWSDLDLVLSGAGTVALDPNSARIVIYSTKALALPVGTVIKVSLIPQLPYSPTDFGKWFSAPDRSIDTYQKIERQQLAFVKADTNSGIEVAYTPTSGTSTSEDIKWLSLATTGGAYAADGVSTTTVTYTFPFGTGGISVINFSSVIPTDKSIPFAGVASTAINIRLRTVGLVDSTWNGFAEFSTLIKFDGYNIVNAAWNTLIQQRVTLP